MFSQIFNYLFHRKCFLFYLLISCLMYIFFFTQPVNSSDYWLHYSMGKYIVTTQSMPYYGVGSWFGENIRWFAHEWLFEIIAYLIGSTIGEVSMNIISFFGTTAILFYFIHKNEEFISKHYYVSLLYFLAFSYSIANAFSFRPHIMSFLFFLIDFHILYDAYNKNEFKNLWWLPIVSILWANLHGGSSSLAYYIPIGFLILLYLPNQILNLTKKNNSKELKKAIWKIIPLCILGVFVNPNGYEMFLYPYTNMNDALMLSFIDEWFPLNITNPLHRQMAFPIMAIVWGALILTKKEKDIIDIGFLAVFTFMTFKCIRFVAYFTMFSGFFIIPYFAKYTNDFINVKHNVKISILALVLLLGLSVNAYNNNSFLKNDEMYRKSAVYEAILREKPQRLYTFNIYGTELLDSEVKPFTDSRADIYTKTVWKDCIAFAYLQKNPENILNKYNFDYVLIARNVPAYWYLKENYKLIEEDENAALFKR